MEIGKPTVNRVTFGKASFEGPLGFQTQCSAHLSWIRKGTIRIAKLPLLGSNQEWLLAPCGTLGELRRADGAMAAAGLTGFAGEASLPPLRRRFPLAVEVPEAMATAAFSTAYESSAEKRCPKVLGNGG